jgi:glutamyl-tRNA reductase
MALIVVGVNHRTAPIELRERLAISGRDVPAAVGSLLALTSAREGVALSTCNRTEIYLVEGGADAVPVLLDWFGERVAGEAEPLAYVRREQEAVTHLYRVASGLDSMIVGEAQIQGQVREAWELSRESAGPMLHRLFQSALNVATRIRTETAIGRGAASVSSAAVQLAKKIFGTLAGRRAMVLGAGEMAELALECLVREGVSAAMVANRSHERAQALASAYGARAIHYDECWARLHEMDLLLASTAAPRAVVHRANIEPAMALRGDRPLCILDIALPRDVDPEVGELSNVFLYDLDDLQAVVAANLERRQAEMPAAERLIASEVDHYWSWAAGLATVPVLTSFRDQMDAVRARELEHAMRKLAHLPPADRAAVEHLSRSLMNKFLHEPTVRLRAAASNGRGLAIVEALRYLFALNESRVEPRDDARESPSPTDHDLEQH